VDEADNALALMRFLRRATVAGVRINALGTSGFRFDPVGDGETHESATQGWATGRWNGPVSALVSGLGLLPEEVACFHFCAPRVEAWEVSADFGEFEPQGFMFDPDPDVSGVPHRSPLHGWGVSVFVEEE
jgi:hypothetical protein